MSLAHATDLGQSPRPPLLVIVGPTAVGKSDLALHLALALGGEIISADSRQVYRYLDIGTAKPTPAEQAMVRHHLIDVVEPDQDYTLARYQADAFRTINDVLGRGQLPLLVGGTGLYVRAVVDGLRIPHVPPNEELRETLEKLLADQGVESLFQELQKVDPEGAAHIDQRNPRRIIRAIEVFQATGQSIATLRKTQPPPYSVLMIGLTIDREELYRRIDVRVDRMISAGLVEEVRDLMSSGYGLNTPAMSGLGYRQIGAYLCGKTNLEQAIETVKYETHRFARQQYTWFRLNDPRIHWFQSQEGVTDKVLSLVRPWLDSLAPW